MTRQLDILGTSVVLPDPASATDLAARFQQQGGELADLETTLQALTRPEAWGNWTGLAADSFGQSIGQLPAQLGDVRDAYETAAAALRQYANELEPVVNALSSLSYQAEDAEGTLAAVKHARAQVIASGHNPATTGWDARVGDATAAVSAVRSQLIRLTGELTALAAACTKQINAAEPRTAHKSLFGQLESDFVRDVADPVGRAAREAVKPGAEAGRLELLGATAIFDALYVHPITDLVHDATRHLDAAKLATILGDVAGVLGILSLIPGVDVVALPAAVIVGGAAAGLEWWAAGHHEQGASDLQAGLDTLTFALSGVSVVARAGVAAGDLADGADAAASGQDLWVSGLQRAFNVPVIKENLVTELDDEGAAKGLAGFGKALAGQGLDSVEGTFDFTFPSADAASSAAGVTLTRVAWAADKLNTVVSTGADVAAHEEQDTAPRTAAFPAGSQVP